MNENEKLLASVPYTKIKTIREPITGLELQKISHKKLIKLVYILNSALFTGKNEYNELLEKYNKLAGK